MTTSDSPQDGEDPFNTPPQQSSSAMSNGSSSRPVQNTPGPNDNVPRPKRIACILCRKRKLKCDGTKPSCGTCKRLGHNCEYSEERKKSGPKRGYVKLLEQRLKQVENLLESQQSQPQSQQSQSQSQSQSQPQQPLQNILNSSTQPMDEDSLMMPPDQIPPMADTTMSGVMPDPSVLDPMLTNPLQDFGMAGGDDFSWEMIGLGLEEALPNQDVIDDLNRIYFDKIHPSIPMIHRGRFLASMDLAPHMRPAVCLRYAMWTHACAITSRYSAYTEHFYSRARKYAEQDEMKGHGESIITLSHCQCWTLLACYEFKLMYFPRAWLSIGRSTRLAQMMGLHRQDRVGLDVKQTLPPPRDWTDKEERRRTFWMAFCQDRYASIGTGWPMTIDEADILTNLPASDEAFNLNKEEQTLQLSEVLQGNGTQSISSFSGVVLLATLYGRNLTHLHRPNENDMDHDLNGEFWKRHRNLDNILLNVAMQMPESLRLPTAISDPNAIFCNMSVHTATICLHQAAIFKADKHKLPAQISAESKRRCIVAADQVTNIMRVISHIDLSLMNPFLAFNLYVAARVFVQYLKSRREDNAVKSSLNFLLSAMQVLKTRNPLTESFLVQLDVDLEGSGLDFPQSQSRYRFAKRTPAGDLHRNPDDMSCSPLYEIRESRNADQHDHPTPAAQQGFNEKGIWPGADNPAPFMPSPSGYDDPWGRRPEQINKERGMGMVHLYPNADFGSEDLFSNRTASSGPGSSGTAPSLLGSGDTPSSARHSNSNGPSPEAMFNGPSPQVSFATGMSPPTHPATSFSPAASDGGIQSVLGKSKHTYGVTTSSNGNLNAKQTPNDQQQQSGTLAAAAGSSTGMTPGATGMTPLPDSMWNAGTPRGDNDWMFGWPGDTPKESGS